MLLNNKHRATLMDIFEDPVRSGIKWSDIESLFKALGYEVVEGSGSRVRIYFNNAIATFHRPHPQKETDRGAVKSVRRFLITAGVTI